MNSSFPVYAPGMSCGCLVVEPTQAPHLLVPKLPSGEQLLHGENHVTVSVGVSLGTYKVAGLCQSAWRCSPIREKRDMQQTPKSGLATGPQIHCTARDLASALLPTH